MGFQLSPGVEIKEFDFTNIIPAVATSSGAYAGRFVWGPADEPITVGGENELKNLFGKPNNNNAAGWFAAANFLSYGRNLKVVRVLSEECKNAAVAISGGSVIEFAQQIPNAKAFDDAVSAPFAVAARYPGELGNAIAVYWYNSAEDHAITGNAIYNQTGLRFKDVFNRAPNTVEGTGLADDATGGSEWARETLGKGNDEINLVVIDRTGAFSGIPNTVLEVYEGYSAYPGAKRADGGSNNLLSAVNTSSQYIYIGDQFTINNDEETLLLSDITGGTNIIPFENSGDEGSGSLMLTGGFDGVPDRGDYFSLDGTKGYGLFIDAEQIDISLIILGAPEGLSNTGTHTLLARDLIQQIAERRKDCVVFVSAPYAKIMDLANNQLILNEMLEWRNKSSLGEGLEGFNVSSSYAVLDSGWKKQYDPYNDVYRWVPLNGDIAGLCARTDTDRDPWYSPAGLNRGQVNRIVRLGFNPNKTQRDELYQAGINPVVSFPGQGVVLFGDKTALAKPSAFDRINVRRLFIVLEKAIATAAKFQLFEFNDEFTRASFVSLVEPFLRDVQGRRGVFDFKVICDSTNNTPEIIDSNRFVADIFIKPARSINFMTLNFIATRTGVDFSEVAGGVGGRSN